MVSACLLNTAHRPLTLLSSQNTCTSTWILIGKSLFFSLSRAFGISQMRESSGRKKIGHLSIIPFSDVEPYFLFAASRRLGAHRSSAHFLARRTSESLPPELVFRTVRAGVYELPELNISQKTPAMTAVTRPSATVPSPDEATTSPPTSRDSKPRGPTLTSFILTTNCSTYIIGFIAIPKYCHFLRRLVFHVITYCLLFPMTSQLCPRDSLCSYLCASRTSVVTAMIRQHDHFAFPLYRSSLNVLL